MRPHDPIEHDPTEDDQPNNQEPNGQQPNGQQPRGLNVPQQHATGEPEGLLGDLDLSDRERAAYGLPGRSAPPVPAPRGRTGSPSSHGAPAGQVGATATVDRGPAEVEEHPAALGGGDDRDALLLLATARRHIGGQVCPQAVNCLSAAADALTDPMHPPVLSSLVDSETADLGAVVAAVRARMLDPDRPGSVGQVLARGYAARELTDALRHLTRPLPAPNSHQPGAAPRRAAPASDGSPATSSGTTGSSRQGQS